MSSVPGRGLYILGLAASLVLTAGTVRAQDSIPNPGFESWSAGAPIGWVAVVLTIDGPVLQTSVCHSGLSAVFGQVLSFDRSARAPELLTRFHVSQRDLNLTGWYQLAPTSGDNLVVNVTMYSAGTPVGSGAATYSAPESTWTAFSLPITYTDGTVVPDSCYILVYIGAANSSSPVHVGSTMLLDDVAFTGAATVEPGAPAGARFALHPALPNPARRAGVLRYQLPRTSRVRLALYDLAGHEVARLLDGEEAPGAHEARFDAARMSPGVYYARLQADGVTATEKLLVLR